MILFPALGNIQSHYSQNYFFGTGRNTEVTGWSMRDSMEVIQCDSTLPRCHSPSLAPPHRTQSHKEQKTASGLIESQGAPTRTDNESKQDKEKNRCVLSGVLSA